MPGQKYVRIACIPCAGSEGSSQEMPGNISTFYSVREARCILLKKAMFLLQNFNFVSSLGDNIFLFLTHENFYKRN